MKLFLRRYFCTAIFLFFLPKNYGVHIERNPTILSFLEKDPAFRYSGRGTGIPRMIKKCREAGVKFQLINDKDKQQFRVVFHRNVPPEIRQEENSKELAAHGIGTAHGNEL